MTSTVAGDCAHCGLAVPAALVDPCAARQFCCEGCRTVWVVLHEHGLESYYAIRAKTDDAPVRATTTGRSYAELDDEAFVARACATVPGGWLSTELYLEGVHCAACVWLVERVPRLVPGLVDVRLDLVRSRAEVRWDPRAISLSAIARALDAIGYAPHPCRGRDAQALRRREDRAMLARIGLAGAIAANVMAIAFALYGGMVTGIEREFATLFRWASLAITVPAVVWGGGVFFRGAWSALRLRTLHMDVPISLGIVAAFLHGAVNTVRGSGDVYFDSVTALIFLLLVGRYLQMRQQRAAADSTELLASLAPTSARLLDGDRVREVPLEALAAGSRVEVRAGDVVPADGVVHAGRSSLDVSLLSGESRPVDVSPGDAVHAGTLNLASRLEVIVERAGEDTRVGRLMKLVGEHSRRRPAIVQLADRLSGWFVAGVLTLAGATLAVWLPLDPSRAVDHAVALLVVTCPCALGLATPLAVSAAIGQAARRGLLVKGADVLEKLSRPGRMWLDKTGTLTEGRVTLVRWSGDESVKPLVAAVESHSAHPVARAAVAALDEHAGTHHDVEIVETHGGGVDGRVGHLRVIVGAPAFVAARVERVPPAFVDDVEALTADGLTPVLVAVDGRVVAAAGFGDALRGDAEDALARVRAHGWRMGVLSGDHPRVVSAVGERLALDAPACRGGVTPEEKLRVVLDDRAGAPVVMVGDGVNDAAALAAATVGVAVHGGAEAAMAAADVYVARAGVAPIAELIEGARRTMRVVRRNLVFSLVYNAVGVALAMSGLLNPILAAVLMPVSSLTVIVGSYRARMFVAGPERMTSCR